jgi:hypothetical protein
VTDSNSVLKGVRLLGDAVHIDSITVASHSETDGRGADKHSDDVTLSGVTVAGQPATIDQRGITVGGAQSGSAPFDSLNDALHQALDAAGAQIRLIGAAANPPHPVMSGCSKGQAEGVLLHVQADLSQLPAGDLYYAEFVLGGACTTATASADRIGAGGTGVDIGSGGGVPALATPGGGAPTTGPATVADLAGGAGPSPSPAGGPAPGTGAGLAARAPSGAGRGAGAGDLESELRSKLVAHRIEVVYAAFCLAFVGLLLGLRPTLPARLPRWH